MHCSSYALFLFPVSVLRARRYVSYDHHLEVAELDDGTLNCQPVTFQRCEPLEHRDHLGRCAALADCTEACGPEGGTFLSSAGICECAKAIAETTQCEGSCKAALPTVTLEGEKMVLKDPETGLTTTLQHPDIDLSEAFLYCSMFRVRQNQLTSGRLLATPGGIACVQLCTCN